MRDQDRQLVVRPPTGGLATKFPPHSLLASQSPDLLNVLFNRRSVKRRAGMAPVSRFHAPGNAIRNRGYSWFATSKDGAANADFKRVDGMAFAGHRPGLSAYNQDVGGGLFKTRLSVTFLTTPEVGNRARGYENQFGKGGLGSTASAGTCNWFRWNSLDGDVGTHITKMRPILSKGPIQGIEDVGYFNGATIPANQVFSGTVGRDGAGVPFTMAWLASEQMPFCFSVYYTTQRAMNYTGLQVGQSFTEDLRIRGRTSGTTATVLRGKEFIRGGTGTVWIKYKTGAAFTAGEQIETLGGALIATLNGGEFDVYGPVWRCSFFVVTVGTPTGRLVHLDSAIDCDLQPLQGHLYRISFEINSEDSGAGANSEQRARLRITSQKGDGTVFSHTISTAPNGASYGSTDQINGSLWTNRQPVQFFDVPVAACQNNANPERAFGIDWDKDVLPYEGKIEDIQLWSKDLSSAGTDWSWADTFERLDRGNNNTFTDLMAYWGPDTVSEQRLRPEPNLGEQDRAWFPEGTGKDLPMVLCPTVPLLQDANGKKSLYFDGRTGYAYMPVGAENRAADPATGATIINQNFRSSDTNPVNGTLAYALGNAAGAVLPHSIRVVAIPDSIEPGSDATNEVPTQVILDWPNVVRLGITNKGHVWAQAPGGPGAAAGGLLATTIVGSIAGNPSVASGPTANVQIAGCNVLAANVLVLQPGQRYWITYHRLSATSYRVDVDDAASGGAPSPQISVTTLTAPPGPNAIDVEPMVLGCWCPKTSGLAVITKPESSYGHAQFDAAGTIVKQRNAMFFVGRIEDVRLCIGQNVSGAPQILVDREVVLDSQLMQHFLPGATDQFVDTNARGILIAGGAGFLVRYPGPLLDFNSTLLGNSIPFSNIAISGTQQTEAAPGIATPGSYTFARAIDGLPNGYETSIGIAPRFEFWLFSWDFDVRIDPTLRQSRHYTDLEIPPDVTVAPLLEVSALPDPVVYEEWGQVKDRSGFALPLCLRSRMCVRWSHRVTSGGGPNYARAQDFAPNLHTQRAPYEIKPRICSGIGIPPLDTNPVTMISQLQKASGDAFLLAAAGATIYSLQPPWQRNISPYSAERDPGQISHRCNGRFRNYNKRKQDVPANGTVTAGVSLLGQNQLTLEFTLPVNFVHGDEIAINWQGSTFEKRTVDSVAGNIVTLTENLTYTHNAAEQVVNVRELKAWVTRAASQVYSANDGLALTIEFWMKIPEYAQQIRRAIGICWDGTPNFFNWRFILHESGLLGNESEQFSVGTSPYATLNPNAATPVINDAKWHHITFVMDQRSGAGTYLPSFDKIFVDGISQSLWFNGVKNITTSPYALNQSAPLDAYIAGTPHELGDPLSGGIGGAGAPFEVPIQGWIKDWRVTRGVRYAKDFAPPTGPLQVEGSIDAPLTNPDMPAGHQKYCTIGLIRFDDGVDQVATDQVAGNAPVEMRWDEWAPINDGSMLASASSARYPWSTEQYNEVVYATNGVGDPVAIRHRGPFVMDATVYGSYAGVFGPGGYAYRGAIEPHGFSVGRFGVTAPGADDLRVSMSGSAGGSAWAGGWVTIAVSFITKDEIESDVRLFTRWVPANANAKALAIRRVPRSLDPHVVRRRIYVSGINSSGAGLFGLEAKLDDNVTQAVEVPYPALPPSTIGYSATRAAPLPARFLRFNLGRSYLANFPMEANGSRIVSFSEGIEVEAHNVTNKIALNAERGNPADMLAAFQGRLVMGMRNSTFALTAGQNIANFQNSRVNASIGGSSGHSVVVFDNRVYFRSQRGVYFFDASGVHYISEDLEGDPDSEGSGIWPLLDHSELAQQQSFGAYFQPNNQYWITVRRIGEAFGSEMLVYDAGVQDPTTQGNPWSLLKLLPHSYLRAVIDESTGAEMLMVGLATGQVQQLLVGQIDGLRELVNPADGQPFAYSGTVNAWSSSSRTLTIASGALDTLGRGARGLFCRVSRSGGPSAQARIKSNTGTTLVTAGDFVQDDGSAFTPQNGDTWEVGYYEAYWTTPWLPLETIAESKKVQDLQFDFAPNSGMLDVLVDSAIGAVPVARLFRDPSLIPSVLNWSIDMTVGHHTGKNKAMISRGMYWRMRMGTRGIKRPFEVMGFVAHFDTEAIKSGRTGA